MNASASQPLLVCDNLRYTMSPPYEPPRPRIPRVDPVPSELENELREYLAHSRTSMSAAANERQDIRKAIANLANMYTLHDQKDEDRHAEVMAMIRGHEARMTALEKDQEITGSWVVGEVKRRHWWKTQAGKVMIEVVKWCLLLTIGFTVNHLACSSGRPTKVEVMP